MTDSSLPNILLLESITKEALDLLASTTHIIEAPSPDRGDEVIGSHEIHGIVTRGKGRVDTALIDACEGLRVIARCGVGLDNVAVEHATSKGIKVINAPGSNADTVAEHTLALMLTAQRKMVDSITSVNAGRWSDRKHYAGDELRTKTLGIIGMGDIGKRVGHLAKAFGMNVIYFNRSKLEAPYVQVALEVLLRDAHIISIHLPLTDETRGLLTATSFIENPHRPILINTARGGIISDKELISALEQGSISAFAGDVLATEPPAPDSPLLKMDNVYVTPHSASLTTLTYNEMCVLTVQHLVDVLSGKTIDPRYVFNKDGLS